MADILTTEVDGLRMSFKYGEDYERFHDCYYKYVKTNTAVVFIENDFLKLMHRNDITYFRVPKNKTLVNHDIAFVFEKETEPMNEETMITLYRFVEVQKY